jgi:pumilio RNA-binding family
VAAIYSAILPKFVELMNNPFGNYLCQKITDACGKDHIKDIINIIKSDIVSICCNAHGTRAIQRIIE